MTIETLDAIAYEDSTYVVVATFSDDAGNVVAPATMSWCLSDAHGNIVNDRLNVVIESPESSESIILSGADLTLATDCEEDRFILVSGTYSSALGAGLTYKQQHKFRVVHASYPAKDD